MAIFQSAPPLQDDEIIRVSKFSFDDLYEYMNGARIMTEEAFRELEKRTLNYEDYSNISYYENDTATAMAKWQRYLEETSGYKEDPDKLKSRCEISPMGKITGVDFTNADLTGTLDLTRVPSLEWAKCSVGNPGLKRLYHSVRVNSESKVNMDSKFEVDTTRTLRFGIYDGDLIQASELKRYYRALQTAKDRALEILNNSLVDSKELTQLANDAHLSTERYKTVIIKQLTLARDEEKILENEIRETESALGDVLSASKAPVDIQIGEEIISAMKERLNHTAVHADFTLGGDIGDMIRSLFTEEDIAFVEEEIRNQQSDSDDDDYKQSIWEEIGKIFETRADNLRDFGVYLEYNGSIEQVLANYGISQEKLSELKAEYEVSYESFKNDVRRAKESIEISKRKLKKAKEKEKERIAELAAMLLNKNRIGNALKRIAGIVKRDTNIQTLETLVETISEDKNYPDIQLNEIREEIDKTEREIASGEKDIIRATAYLQQKTDQYNEKIFEINSNRILDSITNKIKPKSQKKTSGKTLEAVQDTIKTLEQKLSEAEKQTKALPKTEQLQIQQKTI